MREERIHNPPNLAVHRYRREFGDNNIYTLLNTTDKAGDSNMALPPAGHIAFSKESTYSRFASQISLDAEIRETKLSENFYFSDYCKKNYQKAIPLFADSVGNLKFAWCRFIWPNRFYTRNAAQLSRLASCDSV